MPKRFQKILNKDHLRRLPGLRRRGDVIPDSAVPHITNETIAEHREEVLAGARKYIYPLQHSKHRIVLISTALFIATVVTFFAYSILALYKFQSTSTFTYRVTQVIPFPIARANSRFVSYESYLFELRHYMHYYENQQKLSFKSEAGQQQLAAYKKKALELVVNDAYTKSLADNNKVAVSNKEVDNEIAIVRNQNRLGSSEQVFEDVLRDFWGWSVGDFRRSLRQQLLSQKVASTLDTAAHAKADKTLEEIKAGKPFSDVAKRNSDDLSTKDTNGDYPFAIDKSTRDVPPEVIEAVFRYKPGEFSGVIDTGYTLEIIKVTGYEGEKIRAAHIQTNLHDISEYVNPIKDKQHARMFVKL